MAAGGSSPTTRRRGRTPTIAPALAGLVFAFLARDELGSWARGEPSSPLAALAAEGVAVRLALPMTLNNIAGGLAGGVAGVPPALALLFLLGVLHHVPAGVIVGHGQQGLRAPYRFYHPVAYAHGFSDPVLRIHGQHIAVDVDLVMRRRNGARDDRDEHGETTQ